MDLASLSLDKKVDRTTYGGATVQAMVKIWEFLGFTQRARGGGERGAGARGGRGRGSSRLTSRAAARTVWALELGRKGIMSSYRSTFTSMSCVPFTGLAQFCRPPAARGKTWRGVARKELREEGRGGRRRHGCCSWSGWSIVASRGVEGGWGVGRWVGGRGGECCSRCSW